MQQCAEQAEPCQRRGQGVEHPCASARHDVIRHKSQRERRQQFDQPAGQPGDHQPRQIPGRSMQGDSQQVSWIHVPGRERPVEHPGFRLERAGPIRRHTDTALTDRVDLPVTPEHSGEQRNGLTVPGTERQQRGAVATPPAAPGFESHAPGPYARRIKDVDEADRRIGQCGARRDSEIDSLMAADDPQGVPQCRVLDISIPVGRPVVDIEEPLPSRRLGRAPAGGPLPFQVRVINHGQPAVEAFQVECDRMK